jgi:CheY-like chemotaxis protein
MVLVDEPTGMLAEALPQDRRRSLLAAGDEPSTNPLEGRPSRNIDQPKHARRSVRLETVKVLVVDDDAASLDYFSFALETCGAVVSTATTAREALDMVSRVLPDVILSDIAMPGEDGYALIAKVRSLPAAKGGRIAAAALTAYATAEDRARVLRAGYQGHFAKPVEPGQLVSAVAALAERAANGPRS